MPVKPKTTTKLKAKKFRPATQTALSWEGMDYVARKRWWWYLGFSIVVLWLAGVLILMQQLLTLVVLLGSATALVLVNSGRSRTFACTLHGTTLSMGVATADLGKFKAFTLQDQGSSPSTQSPPMIVLIPGSLIALPKSIPLSLDEKLNEQIITQIEGQLPYQDDPMTRILLQMAAWLRL